MSRELPRKFTVGFFLTCTLLAAIGFTATFACVFVLLLRPIAAAIVSAVVSSFESVALISQIGISMLAHAIWLFVTGEWGRLLILLLEAIAWLRSLEIL